MKDKSKDYFNYDTVKVKTKRYTGGPCYMQKIGTPKIDSHITDLHIKRPRMIVN
jgi:hypothetical protein